MNNDPNSLSKLLYEKTQLIHREVEQVPFFDLLMRNQLSASAYHHYLTNLFPIYHALERGMEANLKTHEGLRLVYFPGICRAQPIQEDLNTPPFNTTHSEVSPEAKAYENHLIHLAQTDPLLLISHAYTRYLGDLSGGVMMKAHVAKLWPGAVHFFDFGQALKETQQTRLTALKDLYKSRLNAIPLDDILKERLIEEAQLAFRMSGDILKSIPHES